MDKEFEMFAEGLCNAWESQTDDVEVMFGPNVASFEEPCTAY